MTPTPAPASRKPSLSRDRAMSHATAAQNTLEHLASKWCIAGSLRRGRASVHDIEHVVIPNYGVQSVPGSLFPREVNLLWHQLEQRVAEQTARPHNYGNDDANPSHRLGEKYRGYDLLFRGEWAHHEFFIAEPSTYGAILVIRTGPSLFSELVMRSFNSRGEYRQINGELIDRVTMQRVPVYTEQQYLTLAGLAWVEPHDRDQYARCHA